MSLPYYQVFQEIRYPNGQKETNTLKTNMTKAQAKAFMCQQALEAEQRWVLQKNYDLDLTVKDHFLIGLRFRSKKRKNDIIRISFTVKRITILEILNIR
ncbi:hypothetical protein [Listeria sp. ILCC797]|uniref:hypothetical protein n=1 Tax=Listeria sp. ILCC797 TaxID=1918333 RepID=UPI000B58F449|nr:hypothetical protein [Listeria sp. ILCC797]